MVENSRKTLANTLDLDELSFLCKNPVLKTPDCNIYFVYSRNRLQYQVFLEVHLQNLGKSQNGHYNTL